MELREFVESLSSSEGLKISNKKVVLDWDSNIKGCAESTHGKSTAVKAGAIKNSVFYAACWFAPFRDEL